MADNRLSANTVRSLAAAYPDWDAESVVRIAWRESNFVPTAFADDSDDLSYGLMQLNMKPGTADIPRLRQMFGITRNEELFNPTVNIRAAHVLWLAAGKSFSPWNVVPPVKNYPDTGGSTAIPTTDDQGYPNWQGNDDSSDDPMNWTGEKLVRVAQQYYTAVRDEDDSAYLAEFYEDSTLADWAALLAKLSPHDQSVMNAWRKYHQSTPEGNPSHGGNSVLDDLGDAVGGVLGGIGDALTPDWMSGLGKALSVLTSLSFWKKVGVGVIAAILIVAALALYNKDTTMTLITKGAVAKSGSKGME